MGSSRRELESLTRVHTVRNSQEKKFSCKGSHEKSGNIVKT